MSESKPVPPGTPAPPSGPHGPTHPTPTRPFAPDDLMALADAVFESPARRDPGSAVALRVAPSLVIATGGPVDPSVVVTGKEPTPGSAAAIRSAACESTGVVAGAGAAFPSGEGRVGGASPAPGAACFSLPKPRPFVIGEGPLYDALPRRSRGGRPYGQQPLNPASPYRRP